MTPRFLLLLLLVLPASPSLAQTPDERAYIAERDRATALADAARSHDEKNEVHKRWMPGLEARLRRLIGPGVPEGFEGASEMSPPVLCCYIGKGMLDGILFSVPAGRDDDSAVLVSTVGLLRPWLARNALPADPAEAFLSSRFYTLSGVGFDAATVLHAQLPIVPPAGAGPAAAWVVQLSQQPDGGFPPKHIAVALLKEERVSIALVKATTVLAPIAVCGAILAAIEWTFAPGDGNALRRIEEGEAAFARCWTQRAKDQPGFAAVVRQAQALVEVLAVP